VGPHLSPGLGPPRFKDRERPWSVAGVFPALCKDHHHDEALGTGGGVSRRLGRHGLRGLQVMHDDLLRQHLHDQLLLGCLRRQRLDRSCDGPACESSAGLSRMWGLNSDALKGTIKCLVVKS
jgi:hypothetical protein